jgi:N6-L-threonylcarbamoyladenine synthase
MLCLGIETSCDETGVAIYDTDKGILADVLHSQSPLHAEYGGIIPELASRDHTKNLIPVLKRVLSMANLSCDCLDGIAYTAGPGLIGALMVGASTSKALGMSLNIPTLGVHHMEGHLLAPMLEPIVPRFPFLALLVSGGHTQLVRVDGLGHYKLIGQSLDDAVGETFDKVARMMDMDYPGGPKISALAKHGVSGRFKFPRPMVNRPGLDMSFSGLKTAVLYAVTSLQSSNYEMTKQDQADIAYAFEEAIVDTLVIKARRALKETGLTRLVVAGGVGANLCLRERMASMADSFQSSIFYPRIEYCTDNGAMIAYAGAQRLIAGEKDDLSRCVNPRWSLQDLQ